jgi:uncharacterized protein HemX
MRRRLTVLFALILILSAGLSPLSSVQAAPHVWAQDETGGGDPTGEADETSSEEQDEDGAGQDDPVAESGADEAAEGDTPAGPPWTYQMARMGVLLLLLIALGLGGAYWKFVMSRQKTG